MKILLTGKNGQVGWELQRTLAALGEVIATGSAELDLADADAIRRMARSVKPDLIVNAAAYTAVDRAEQEPGLAMAVNGAAPGILAEEARRLDAMLIHYSTDYVFSGEKAGPYTEADATGPLSTYGKTKLAGEQAIAAAGCRHLILRTSWVYGMRGKNFLLTMLRLLRERESVGVVNDQFGAPGWSRWLAEATLRVAASRPLAEFPTEDSVYHLTPSGTISWHEFACEIRHRMNCPAAVVAIPTEDYPTPARRPKNSALSGARIEREFGLYRPDWKDLLGLCLRDAQA